MLSLRQRRQVTGETLRAAPPSALQQPPTLGCCGELDGAAIDRVRCTTDEAVRFERADESRHRRCADALGDRYIAQAKRPGKDDDGEGGETGGGDAERSVLATQLSKEVYRH